MKKFLMIAGIAGILFAGSELRANPIMEKIALWPVNIVVNALDTFTVNVGFGPWLEAKLQATQAVAVGSGVGYNWKMYKAYNRQYGFGTEQGWYWQFVSIGEEDMSTFQTTRLVNQYIERRSGFPMPTLRIYDLREGSRDYWAIGGSLGGLITGDVYIHPVEIADFVTGIFFYDLKGDDLVFDDFR